MAEEESSSSSSDESLNFSSPKFDPLKALYSKNAKVPVPNAKTLDNLAKYASLHRGRSLGRGRGQASCPKPGSNAAVAGPSGLGSSTSARRFHSSQMPVRGGRPRRARRNVLTRMEAAPPPLRRLYQAARGQPPGRIRVVTRNEYGIHGRLEGYPILFDKHLNLAMMDVTEVYYRSAPERAQKLFLAEPEEDALSAEVDAALDAELLERVSGLSVSERRPRDKTRRPGNTATTAIPQAEALEPNPEVIIGGPARSARGRGGGPRAKERLADWPPLPKVIWRPHGKRQECVRHIPQLLVRGEHVVYIQFLSPAAPETASEPLHTGE